MTSGVFAQLMDPSKKCLSSLGLACGGRYFLQGSNFVREGLLTLRRLGDFTYNFVS